LYYLLCSGLNVAEIERETRGSAGQSNISLSQCRDFIFPVPSIDEQTELAQRVKEWFNLLDKLEHRFANANGFIGKLSDAILSKAFSGTLVSQDPTDGSASALLEKIKSGSNNQSNGSKSKRTKRSKEVAVSASA
jgi:type I restriction enzyme S subunit